MNNILSQFLPKDKFDIKSIQGLYDYKYPFYKPILNNLYEWIQDINWPVANIIIPLLIKAEFDNIPILKNILSGNDVQWKYTVLNYVIPEFNDNIKNEIIFDLSECLINIVNNQNKYEVEEGIVNNSEELLKILD